MSEQYPECCCPSPDGVVCVAIRYNQEIEDVDEPCECFCHFLEERREDDFYLDADIEATTTAGSCSVRVVPTA